MSWRSYLFHQNKNDLFKVIIFIHFRILKLKCFLSLWYVVNKSCNGICREDIEWLVHSCTIFFFCILYNNKFIVTN